MIFFFAAAAAVVVDVVDACACSLTTLVLHYTRGLGWVTTTTTSKRDDLMHTRTHKLIIVCASPHLCSVNGRIGTKG